MPLNWPASSSSSSWVRTSIRWPKSPSPSRLAPVESAVIGISIRRARIVPASIATSSPTPISSATRTSWSRIGASACAVGCSKNTIQPSFGTVLEADSTELPSAPVPCSGSRLTGAVCAATCGSFDEVACDLRPLGGAGDDLAALIDHIGEGRLADLGVAEEIRQEAQIDLGDGDVGIEAGMRHRDRHEGLRAVEINRREADAARDRLGEARVVREIRVPVGQRVRRVRRRISRPWPLSRDNLR